MELLLLLVAVLLAVSVVLVLVHRHIQVAAWDRELDQAFGVAADREVPRHRTL